MFGRLAQMTSIQAVSCVSEARVQAVAFDLAFRKLTKPVDMELHKIKYDKDAFKSLLRFTQAKERAQELFPRSH